MTNRAESFDAAQIEVLEHVATGDIFSLNHLEYDTETLRNEFMRDQALDATTPLPHNYFPHMSPAERPANTWRSTAGGLSRLCATAV